MGGPRSSTRPDTRVAPPGPTPAAPPPRSQLALRMLDDKAPDIKAANAKLLAALHATLGASMLDESARLGGAASAQKLRSQLPGLAH